MHILTLRCDNKAGSRPHRVQLIKTLVIADFLRQLLVKVSFACMLTIGYAGLVTCRAPTLDAHKDALGVKIEFRDFVTVLYVYNRRHQTMATPFTIKVEQSAIDDLKRRLERTRLPDHISGSHWDYGTEASYLQVQCLSASW